MIITINNNNVMYACTETMVTGKILFRHPAVLGEGDSEDACSQNAACMF